VATAVKESSEAAQRASITHCFKFTFGRSSPRRISALFSNLEANTNAAAAIGDRGSLAIAK
jgi:hypothetical protein